MGIYDECEEYGALLVDTSIFEKHGLRLDRGLLAKLKQFSVGPISFIVPDVIQKELASHISKKIRQARQALEKSLKDASEYGIIGGSRGDEVKDEALALSDVDDAVAKKLHNFIATTGAIDFECGRHISVTQVLDRYFSSLPPFAEGGSKKSEFPDAIVLLAVEAWGIKNSSKILAVSTDNDWKQFCEGSDQVDFIDDLSIAIAHFNADTAPPNLLETFRKSMIAEGALYEALETILANELDDLTPDQDASSAFYWEPEGSCAAFKGFQFLNDDIKIVDHGEDYVAISFVLEITVEATGDFSLSVRDSIDRDYVAVDSVSKTVDVSFESEVVVSISGNLHGEEDELTIDDVVVESPLRYVNFGLIEPDFSSDEFDYDDGERN